MSKTKQFDKVCTRCVGVNLQFIKDAFSRRTLYLSLYIYKFRNEIIFVRRALKRCNSFLNDDTTSYWRRKNHLKPFARRKLGFSSNENCVFERRNITSWFLLLNWQSSTFNTCTQEHKHKRTHKQIHLWAILHIWPKWQTPTSKQTNRMPFSRFWRKQLIVWDVLSHLCILRIWFVRIHSHKLWLFECWKSVLISVYSARTILFVWVCIGWGLIEVK